MNPPPEPICFNPIYKKRVWGGRALSAVFGRSLTEEHFPCGESWELSDRKNDQTTVAGGRFDGLPLSELWNSHRSEIFGERLKAHPAKRFPLLLKILDAEDDLSIQVHPPEEVAAELGGESKFETWLVAATQPGSKLYVGLKNGISKEDFRSAIESGRATEVVGVIEPKVGDFVHLPSGRLHAIGAGTLVFEVQQNSDTTYRVFDWNRKGLNGEPRELHIEEAMRSIDFNDTHAKAGSANGETLVTCPHYEIKKWAFDGARPCGSRGECAIFAVLDGEIGCGEQQFRAGDFFLIPAFCGDAELVANTELATIIRISFP